MNLRDYVYLISTERFKVALGARFGIFEIILESYGERSKNNRFLDFLCKLSHHCAFVSLQRLTNTL